MSNEPEILSITSKPVDPVPAFQQLDAELAAVEPGKTVEITLALRDGLPGDRRLQIAGQARRALSAFAKARWGSPAGIAVEVLAEVIKFTVRRSKARRAAAEEAA